MTPDAHDAASEVPRTDGRASDGLGYALSYATPSGDQQAAAPPSAAARQAQGAQEIVLRVNGVRNTLRLDLRVTLLDALRDHLGLTGPKKGCDHGQCV